VIARTISESRTADPRVGVVRHDFADAMNDTDLADVIECSVRLPDARRACNLDPAFADRAKMHNIHAVERLRPGVINSG
jgi:hypothetical protein